MTIPSYRGILWQYRTILIFLISPNTNIIEQRIAPTFLKFLNNIIACDSDVLFNWTLITGDESSDEELLHTIINLWVTMRGFSFAKSIVEKYRIARREPQKAKAFEQSYLLMNSNKISCSVLYLHSKLQHAYVNCNRNQIEILLFFDLFLRGCMAAFKSSSFYFHWCICRFEMLNCAFEKACGSQMHHLQ